MGARFSWKNFFKPNSNLYVSRQGHEKKMKSIEQLKSKGEKNQREHPNGT